MSIRTLRPSPVGVLIFLGVGLICCALGGLGGDGMLFLAPALVLAGALLARRYPGERLLIGLAARRRTRRARTEIAARPSSSGRAERMPRGGLLMGFALAVRPPPPFLAAS